MASGHASRIKGRTHGCSDQACDVKKVLANAEPFSNRSDKRKRKMAIGHTTSPCFFAGHFSGSTAPQAFPRPDRRIETPTRAGRVKAGRFISGHRRLGLDTAEHDGTLVGSRPTFLPSLPGLAFGRSCCPIRVTVLSAVGCAPLQHLVRSTGAARSTASSHAGAAQRPPPQSSAPSPRRATNRTDM